MNPNPGSTPVTSPIFGKSRLGNQSGELIAESKRRYLESRRDAMTEQFVREDVD